MSVTELIWISRFLMVMGVVVGIVTVFLYVKLDIEKTYRLLMGIPQRRSKAVETKPVTQLLPKQKDEMQTQILEQTRILSNQALPKPVTKFEVTYIHTDQTIP